MTNPDKKYKHKFQEDIFPANWINPKAAGEYDLIVVGGGPGGMTAATIAKTFNARVALVEKEHLGGECLSYGCIPSKAMLRSSRVAHEIKKASSYGLEIPGGLKVDFTAVMQRIYDLQATLSPHDSAEHFKKLGIDVFFGTGHFTGPNQLEVSNQTIRFKKAIILTGTQPILLNVPGLEPSDYWTNQDIFNLPTLPRRFGIIGGGPISSELSQAFMRFGSQVTLVVRGPKLLPKDDVIAAERLRKVFENEGMKIFSESQVQRIEKKGNEKILYLDTTREPIIVDEVFVAIGRLPATDGLDLEKANVSYDEQNGILTNDYLQTSNPDIYAAGDVTSQYKFTHISVELAKNAVLNALKGSQKKASSLIVPWCTYTDPEVAHIGLNEQEAEKQGISVEVVLVEMADVDRAILDGETVGFVKLLVRKDTDQLIGGTIMAAHAGDMISQLSIAMASEKGLIALSQAIHPFPTQSQVLRTAAETLLKNRILSSTPRMGVGPVAQGKR